MICPRCNTPNHPEAVYCRCCGALLPSPAELRRQKRYAIAVAVTTAMIVPLFYYFVINAVCIVWATRFFASAPAGMSQSEFTELYIEAFNRNTAYLNILSACICIFLVAILFALKRRSFADAVNLRSASAVKTGAALVCGLTLQIPIGIVISVIPFPETVIENHSELMNASTSPLPIQLLYAVIIAPIVEEMLFRGIAHDRLSKVMPVPLAAAISAAGFAVIHGEAIAILVAFACGYILAMLYSKFRTIVVPIAFHMGFNLLSYVVPYIKDPVILTAAAVASVGLFIGSTYLLLKKDMPNEQFDVLP